MLIFYSQLQPIPGLMNTYFKYDCDLSRNTFLSVAFEKVDACHNR